MDIGIGILAGGKSTRMGQDKSKLIYRNNTFLNNLLLEFKGFDIIVSTNDRNIREYYSGDYVFDKYENIGPISGILEILKKSKYKYNFILGVDMQNINLDFLEYLHSYISIEYKLFTIESKDKYHPLGGIYSKDLIPILEDFIENNNYKLQNLIKMSFSKIINLKYSKFNDLIFKNINTPNEYKKLINGNILSICGRKNSGKTTFISKVVSNLKNRGYEICVIKHDGHDFHLNDNTDTGKFYSSGADGIGLFSDYKYMIMEKNKIELEDLIAKLRHYDLVIIEGLKNSDLNKFEIVRKANSNNNISSKKLTGIITDIEELRKKYDINFQLDDIEIFSDFIIENYILS